jgi:hypothetical protein
VFVQPMTVIARRRRRFREHWRKLCGSGKPARPVVSRDVRDLIRRISSANRLWGAPRIVGELKKIGIDLAKSTVEKYMVRRRKPPSPTWRAVLKSQSRRSSRWAPSPCRPCGTETAWQYIPVGFGRISYFILLNTYDDGGPYNWSCQVFFDSASFSVWDDFGNNLPWLLKPCPHCSASSYMDSAGSKTVLPGPPSRTALSATSGERSGPHVFDEHDRTGRGRSGSQ